MRGVGEVVHHLQPLLEEDGARLFGMHLGSAAVEAGGWTLAKAVAVSIAVGGVPSKIMEVVQQVSDSSTS
jgi:hypothetical protein